MGRPKKSQTAEPAAEAPVFDPNFVAAPEVETASSFPESEEAITDAKENVIADAIREVAYSFRDLAAVLVQIFLVPHKGHPAAGGPVEAVPQGGPTPPISPPAGAPVAAPAAPPPAPVVPPPPAEPQAAPASAVPSPAPDAPPFRDEDVNFLIQSFRAISTRPGAKGAIVPLPEVVMKFLEQMPHLKNPETLFNCLRYVDGLGQRNPAYRVFSLIPPSAPGLPAGVQIL